MATSREKGAPAGGSATVTDSAAPRDFDAELQTLRARLEAAKAYLRLDELSERLAELEVQLAEPDLWSDADRARRISTAYGRVKADVDLLVGLEHQLAEAEELLALGLEEGETGLAEVAGDLAEVITSLEKALDDIELRSLFGGEHNEANPIAEIHAGAGGTDAQDWAEMMLRMYLRWAERRGFEVEIDEESEGQEAGILSATFIVHGPYAYGLLATERGVHRLVRMSPYDSQHRRQTSFASLDVVPFLEDAGSEVEIDEKDLRVDTYRSSGAGGQHVNKTDSAIRLTHLPTGIVVSCQNERSQHQNRAKAMQILAAKLADLQRAERRAELDALSGPESDNAWGSQIRSYVMAPYQLVKDLRSGYETGNVAAVLDGDLDDLIVATLRWKREHSGS
jgi:peptide chain release factor 2